MTRPLDKEFRLGPYTVGVIPAALPHVKNKLPKVLRLMHLSNAFGKDIDHDTWESIRQAMKDEPQLEWSSESASQFMALLEETSRLGFLLGRLREMRVLEHIIPAFGHARGLLQFNEYHKYTVDEHSILAVERATEFLNSRGTLGTVYRSLREKHLLHLALLIHDLGKGFAEDHSEVGRRIAEETATRLELDREDAEDVKFLVHNHLMMAHVAFRRDINDEAMVAEFAANVGSVKLLKMLYLLTCADIAAVGPNTLSDWKLELLTDLYHNAKNLLTGHHGIDGAERGLEDKFAAIAALGSDPDTQQWLARQARALPRNYCRGHAPELIAGQLLDIKDAVGDHTRVWVESLPAKRLVELSIGKRERLRSGIFYRVNGLLASLGLKIVNADIKHLTNSLVWYWFQFEDPDFAEPPAERLQQIRDRTLELVRSTSHEPIEITSRWQADYDRTANLPRAPIRVQIDNQTVQSANVIDVFAHYRLGLQYVISKRIYELGLDVRFARISTYGEQIVNVFYVTDEHGQKIRDARRLVDIRRKLLQVTREFLGETDTGTTRSEAAG
jgi:[protein-PII] uridylyltransferase